MRANSRPVHSKRVVKLAIERMAGEIAPRIADKNPVVLAVMHGGAFTALELCKHFDFPHEFDYCHVTRYHGDTAGGQLEWRVRPSPSLHGRTVLIVDDILDRGHTLRALRAELIEIGVAAHLTAVLVVKRLFGVAERPGADFIGLPVDDVYVFGCGMDYRGYWRELRSIYAVKRAKKAKPAKSQKRAK